MSAPAAESNTEQGRTVAPSTGRTEPNAQEQRTDLTPTSSAVSQEQESRGPDYIRDAFARLRGYTQAAAPAPQVDANGVAAETAPQAPPVSDAPAPESERSVAQPTASPERSSTSTTLPPPPGQRRQQGTQPSATGSQANSQSITLTPDEYARRIQAEADRIIAKREKDAQAKAARDQEVELRRTNPFEYARLMEQKETELEASRAETERLTQIIGSQLHFYDRAVLDTFVGALSPEEQKKVIAPDGDGIENRKATAANTLKALRSRWVAEGRASAKADLMKDQTFIKEVLARYGQAAPEPEAVPVAIRPAGEAAPQNGNDAMNSWMRAGAQQARAITGR